jgi:3'5'-cyclic nucleotide phosphodiesterase
VDESRLSFSFYIEQIGIFIGMFQKGNLIATKPGFQNLFQFAVNTAKNYFDNPYHSFNHAVDVAYVSYYMIEDLGVGEQLEMTLLDKSIMYISALAHDVLHPGTNNLFQVRNSPNQGQLKYSRCQKI